MENTRTEYRTSLEESPNESMGNGGRVRGGGEQERYPATLSSSLILQAAHSWHPTAVEGFGLRKTAGVKRATLLLCVPFATETSVL